MTTKLEYKKVTPDDPEVKLLVASTGLPVKDIVTLVNGNRYRQAYNRRNAERMKVVRRLVKERPELLSGMESGKEGK